MRARENKCQISQNQHRLTHEIFRILPAGFHENMIFGVITYHQSYRHPNSSRSRRTSSNFFDVTVGSYDGAESRELVGTYHLHNFKERFGNACNFGLYRDDGLGVTKASPRQAELIKKKLCGIFFVLETTIEASKKEVNFLDVTLNLANGKYLPYNKPGNIPLYGNKKSNHPPRIIENIPKSINKMLSEIFLR